MSQRLRRSQSLYNLDYAALHNSGERVHKSNMDVNKLKIKEKQVRSDLVDSLRLYDLQDLETIDDVLEGLDLITNLGKDYRHTHIELETAMGETDYLGEYEKAPETSEKVRRSQVDAKKKIKQLKIAEDEKNSARITAERKEQEVLSKREMITVEEEVFRGKLQDEIDNNESDDFDSIKISCKRFEDLLDECYTLLSKAKIAFGAEFDNIYKDLFNDSISKIRKEIKSGKDKISALVEEEQKHLAQEKARDSKVSHDSFEREQKSCIDILTNEIELRSKTLVAKCQSSTLSRLNDYELLDRRKNLGSIDVEMREIFGKFSEISKVVVSLGPGNDGLLSKSQKLQDKALPARNTYAQELYALICDRDVSDEKLKKSKELPIELSKFRGYDSKLDIFSFRSEFEKLIQPSIQKRYWADILKKNYLAGAALTLVEKCETVSEVWEKLTDAYGNVKLLLQNKISQLDKFDNLDKVKGDEKLGVALAKIVNMMTELTTLAQKYNLEAKLYVGGGLEKVLSLLGDARERRFFKDSLKKNITPKSSGTAESEVCAERLEWENLKKFLDDERALREKMTLVQKSKESLGICSQNKQQPRDKKSSGSVNTGSVELICCFCNQKDHIISTDPSGKKVIDYFSCKKFVDLSPKERRAELMKKKFCFQCLTPGMKHF